MSKKRIFITGAAGFIGSHLAEYCVEAGYEVVAFDRYNSNNHWGWLENSNYKNDMKIILGDIRDYDSVSKSMKECDWVFHLAALIGIPYSYESPLAYIRTNVEGTYNVLESAKAQDKERVLVTSTSEVYGTALYVPIDEKHPKQPQSPYSATKIGADSIADSFYRAFNLPVTIVRPFNTYGPRQSARAVIPTIITQLLSGEKEINLGATEPTRDLVYVKDTVRGFVKIAENTNTIGQEINIATEDEISIGDLALKLISLIHPEAKIIKDVGRMRPGKSEVMQLLGSAVKLKEFTGYSPETSLDEGLKETIEWFKDTSNLSTYKHNLYNV